MKKPRAKRAKRPKHPGEVRAWRFALRLDQDVSALHRALDTAWVLRNELAAARAENGRAIRDAKRAGLVPQARLTKRDQEMVLAERRRRDPKGAGALHSLVVKNIADRIDEGWGRFWDACKERRPNVRPPKPIRRERYRSITYPQYGNGARLRDGRIELSMIGTFRLHDHRKVRGRIQTVTLKWAHGRWWCVLTSLIQAKDLYRPVRAGAGNVGGDPGLTAALTLSDGRSSTRRGRWTRGWAGCGGRSGPCRASSRRSRRDRRRRTGPRGRRGVSRYGSRFRTGSGARSRRWAAPTPGS